MDDHVIEASAYTNWPYSISHQKDQRHGETVSQSNHLVANFKNFLIRSLARDVMRNRPSAKITTAKKFGSKMFSECSQHSTSPTPLSPILEDCVVVHPSMNTILQRHNVLYHVPRTRL